MAIITNIIHTILSYLKGPLVYELNGAYPAENFFAVNRSTGAVTLIKDIDQDALLLSTYTVSHLINIYIFASLKFLYMVLLFF